MYVNSRPKRSSLTTLMSSKSAARVFPQAMDMVSRRLYTQLKSAVTHKLNMRVFSIDVHRREDLNVAYIPN